MNTLAIRATNVAMGIMWVSALTFLAIGFSPLGVFVFITVKYGFPVFFQAGMTMQIVTYVAWLFDVYVGVRLGIWLYMWIFGQVAEWFADRMEFAGTWKSHDFQ